MITLSPSELQKKISVLSQTSEPIRVFDKRKNQEIGTFFPKGKKRNMIEELAGSLKPSEKNLKKTKNMNFQEIRQEAQKKIYQKNNF